MLAALIVLAGAVLLLALLLWYVGWGWSVAHAKVRLLQGYLADERLRNNGYVNEPCDLRGDAVA